jgi:hypothetical protein
VIAREPRESRARRTRAGRVPREVRAVDPGSWDQATITTALREWAALVGPAPRAHEWSSTGNGPGVGAARWLAEHPRWPSAGTVVYHFGSWSDALHAAGLPTLTVQHELPRRERVATALALRAAGESLRSCGGGRSGLDGSGGHARDRCPNRIGCRFLRPSRRPMRKPQNTPESIRQNIAARKAREAAQQQAAQDRPSVGFVDGWILATELPPSTIVVSKTGMFHRAGCPHLTADSISMVRLPTPDEIPGESEPKCSNGYCWG